MRQIITVQELKDKLKEILSKDLIEKETRLRREKCTTLINLNKTDYVVGHRVLRVGLNSFNIYEPYTGNLWTISNELIAIFSYLYKKIIYSDLLAMREDLLKKGGTRTEEEIEDYRFITQFINLYTFCNLLDFSVQLSGSIINMTSNEDFNKIISLPEYMSTDLFIDWLSENLGVNSIQPTQLNSLKYGEVFL